MLKALTCVSLFLVTGCATVSMVSKEAVVETQLAQEQSQLRQSSDAFKSKAEDAGWVSESRGLMDFANILFGGSEQTDGRPARYAEQIDAAEADLPVVFETIATDARSANEDLIAIDALASALLASGEVSRADVISFETALVTAQKSYRNFAEATGTAMSDVVPAIDRYIHKKCGVFNL